MRAVPPLLVLAAAAAVIVAVTAAAPPSVLLVLRAACRARDPAALDRAAGAGAALNARVLSYRDTCGPGWIAAVTRESLAAMSTGGELALLGWPGATTCDALVAAARAIGARPPPACALQSARAAAVAQLVTRSGWRRCVIPPAPPRSECRAAQLEVRKALHAAAVYTVAHSEDTALPHHLVILCASRQRGVVAATGSADEVARAAAVLLLHVEEPEAASASPAADPMEGPPSHAADQTLAKRSIDVGTVSHWRPGSVPTILKFNTSRIKRGAVVDSSYFQTSKESNDNSSGSKENYSDPVRRRRPDYLFSYIDDSLRETRRELLVLSADELDGERSPRDIRQLYDEAIDAVRGTRDARSRTVDFTFYVYRRAGKASTWSRAGSVMTTSKPALDDAPEWVTKVHEGNASDTLVALGDAQYGEDAETPGSAGLAAVSAGAAGGVVLAVVAALAVRWAAARRRRRRRGGDAVLSPADFSFPADEQRCVGDGMETMLSCWLQRLHEFGGPELDQPDLLKRPVPLSAPSSTCSVNRIALDRRIRYKGDAVHVKPMGVECSEAGADLKRKAVDVLLLMQSLRHENLNPFIGYMCSARAGTGPALVWDHCGRGSLEDVLMADDIKLDWTFRLSMLTDLVKGMRYLHASPLRVHGRLSSRNCVVDSRWVLRVTDYGTPALERAHQVSLAPPPAARDLLWTAPELLRSPATHARGSQPGDVYSFAIIMQEVIVRGEPYCMLALTPDEIVEKLRRPPPLIRPSVSMGAAPPEAVSVMRQCWSEAPDLRPDFHRLHDLFRQLHRGRKVNIVDSMFEMLEKYSNNLEELIKDRTEQLDMEKKKTEQLLNRMLPRTVAERLLLGSRVEPEEFAEVSIYFSDIVGFTALAARSTPVQVVDLLNDLYTTFDAAIERYDVYKVETIGDAYMVVGGLPARARDHAQSVATMALHLLHLAGRFRVRHLPDTPLHLRIGLHSGPCCAAVVGLTMPRYCLFGDTVNTASRMESTGAAWRIQVSAATAERLATAGGYRLRSRGLVMIKGKGAMHTYWLLGKDGFDKPLPAPPPLPSEEVLFETDAESECEASVEPPAGAPPSPPAAAASAPTLAAPDRSRGGVSIVTQCNARTAPVDDDGARRSGALSADSSPPAPAHAGMPSALPAERAPHARYRRAPANGGSAGSLRRQWSLERGEALASALAERAPSASLPSASLLAAESAARAPPTRYRTRPESRDDPP